MVLCLSKKQSLHSVLKTARPPLCNLNPITIGSLWQFCAQPDLKIAQTLLHCTSLTRLHGPARVKLISLAHRDDLDQTNFQYRHRRRLTSCCSTNFAHRHQLYSYCCTVDAQKPVSALLRVRAVARNVGSRWIRLDKMHRPSACSPCPWQVGSPVLSRLRPLWRTWGHKVDEFL